MLKGIKGSVEEDLRDLRRVSARAETARRARTAKTFIGRSDVAVLQNDGLFAKHPSEKSEKMSEGGSLRNGFGIKRNIGGKASKWNGQRGRKDEFMEKSNESKVLVVCRDGVSFWTSTQMGYQAEKKERRRKWNLTGKFEGATSL